MRSASQRELVPVRPNPTPQQGVRPLELNASRFAERLSADRHDAPLSTPPMISSSPQVPDPGVDGQSWLSSSLVATRFARGGYSPRWSPNLSMRVWELQAPVASQPAVRAMPASARAFLGRVKGVVSRLFDRGAESPRTGFNKPLSCLNPKTPVKPTDQSRSRGPSDPATAGSHRR